MNIDGNAAIVTGGASGLGAATADMLAGAGAKVTVFDLNAELGAAKAAAIGGHFVRVDVADDDEAARALAEAEARHGAARILVNCAGIGPPQKTVGRDGQPHALADFRRIIDVNLIGTFNLISKVAAGMARTGTAGEEQGVIINTASVAAFEGQVGQAAYAASKAAIVGMTLPIARDLARLGIRVVTIAPGLFLTPLLASLPAEAQDSLASQVPFPARLGRPAEYAELVRAILANPMMNGETIRLDGAIRMAPR